MKTHPIEIIKHQITTNYNQSNVIKNLFNSGFLFKTRFRIPKNVLFPLIFCCKLFYFQEPSYVTISPLKQPSEFQELFLIPNVSWKQPPKFQNLCVSMICSTTMSIPITSTFLLKTTLWIHKAILIAHFPYGNSLNSKGMLILFYFPIHLVFQCF